MRIRRQTSILPRPWGWSTRRSPAPSRVPRGLGLLRLSCDWTQGSFSLTVSSWYNRFVVFASILFSDLYLIEFPPKPFFTFNLNGSLMTKSGILTPSAFSPGYAFSPSSNYPSVVLYLKQHDVELKLPRILFPQDKSVFF